LIADDEPTIVASLAGLIEDEAGLELVATAGNAEEAIALAVRHRPDVALIDVRMPAGGGPRATREIVSRVPETAVVALSANGDRDSVFRMLEAGALGYLVKGRGASELIETIEKTARRESALSAEVTRHVVSKLSRELRSERVEVQRRAEIDSRVQAAIDGAALRMVFQPILTLTDGRTVGYEALARFLLEPYLAPDRWFADAEEVGRRMELEVEAIRRAITVLPSLPSRSLLSLNTSPATLVSGSVAEALTGLDLSRVVLEVTEHAPIDDYGEFTAALEDMRDHGLRLAVDDAGAGFASLRHILMLGPDVIKLDRTLIEHVESDRHSRALTTAFVGFAREMEATVLAEGIERAGQVEVLLELGVTHGQGYLFGPPGPLV
jgi:EAL domain-containing protein (putative c-di-GMP-specific phosphodiesterase class I)/DNA-binding NarL/FixJ family response regulator